MDGCFFTVVHISPVFYFSVGSFFFCCCCCLVMNGHEREHGFRAQDQCFGYPLMLYDLLEKGKIRDFVLLVMLLA